MRLSCLSKNIFLSLGQGGQTVFSLRVYAFLQILLKYMPL